MADVTAELDNLEKDARAVLASPHLTHIERCLAFERLLAKYRVLEEYRRAFRAYVRRMQSVRRSRPADPEEIVRDILASPEFTLLRLAVFAMLLAVLYEGGPRSGWVPVAFLPLPVVSVGLRL